MDSLAAADQLQQCWFVSWHVLGKISTVYFRLLLLMSLVSVWHCVRRWLNLSNIFFLVKGFFLLFPALYSCHFMLLWHCLTLWLANSGHWPGRRKTKQKEWNIFSVALINKIESAKNPLSRSSAAAEKSRIMQLRKRAEERKQLFLFEKSSQSVFLNYMGVVKEQDKGKGKKPSFCCYFWVLRVENSKLMLSRCLSPKTWLGAMQSLTELQQSTSSSPRHRTWLPGGQWGNFLLLTNINHIT